MSALGGLKDVRLQVRRPIDTWPYCIVTFLAMWINPVTGKMLVANQSITCDAEIVSQSDLVPATQIAIQRLACAVLNHALPTY